MQDPLHITYIIQKELFNELGKTGKGKAHARIQETKDLKPHLSQGAVVRKIATYCFPIDFTCRKMNQPLLIIRTVLYLKTTV